MRWIYKKFNELNLIELYNIFKVRNEVFIMEQRCIYPDADGKDLNALHLYAEKDNEIIAYLRILDKNVSYNEASIGRVLVTQPFRRTGLGREIVQKAITYIEDTMGETKIKISAQAYLKDFYHSFGFEPVSELYLEDEIPHLKMLYQNNNL